MTKIVCDVCGCDATFHCTVPCFNEYKAEGGCPKVTLAKFSQLEVVDFDLCNEHASMLANFIRCMEESPNVL